LFTGAKNDGAVVLTLDDVYKLDPSLDASKETTLEVKDLGIKRGLLFECDAEKEIIKQISATEAETLRKEYEGS
jgi:hypothetical protein